MTPVSPAPDSLVHLDPAVILMEDNARFDNAVATHEAEQMRASILDVGRIMEPVGVTPLVPPSNGHLYKLRYGFRRVAGATLANEAGAGILVPALILHDADTVGTLKEQIAENVVRKTLSLMDTATAARKLLDAGQSRAEVCAIFTRPVGTKGGGIKPASNAWLNMVLNLLDLPKSIQARVHNNDIGLAAAYRLCKAPADKRLEILARAEKDQDTIRDIEEKEEEAFSKLEAKVIEATVGAEKAVLEADTAKADVELAEKSVELAKATVSELYQKKLTAESAIKKAKNDEAKKKAKAAIKAVTERWKGADTDLKAAESDLASAQKALTKATTSTSKLSETAANLRQQLEDKRNAVAAKPKKAKPATEGKVSPKAIDKAAKEAGVEVGKKRLSGAEMRKCIEDLSLVTSYPKVATLGQAIKECFDSSLTEGQMVKKLAAITGELKPAARK